jgi:mRNA interferase RelE/StbE
MSCTLQFKVSLEKDLKPLSKTILLRVSKQMIALQKEPLPHQATKLKGMEYLYRIRVGDYRVVYEVEPEAKVVTIHYVRHQRDVYRQL